MVGLVSNPSLAFVLIDRRLDFESKAICNRRFSSCLILELEHAIGVDLSTTLPWNGFRLVNNIVELLVILQRLHLVLRRLST